MARNAVNLIISTGLAVVATIYGGPQAGAAVFSLSSIALGILNPSTPSANLDDIRVNSSAYGEFIDIVYNTAKPKRTHLAWASAIRAKKRGHGGYEYGQDLRYIVCESPRTVEGNAPAFVTVKRIWLNKQLVFTTDPNDELSNIIDLIATRVDVPIFGNLFTRSLLDVFGWFTKSEPGGEGTIQVIKIYYGEPTQMPSPLQAAEWGNDNTPAYRGVISIEIANCPLHLYGNAIPQLEVELTVSTIGANPDFIVYDPAWEDGQPIVEHTEWTGYRDVLEIFASPTYHPNTMLILMGDNTDEAGSPLALGRRNALTGEWERTAEGVEKVALLDYDGTGALDFVWSSYVPPVIWPPASEKLYSARYILENQGGTAADFWFVEWDAEFDAEFGFTFRQKSETPADKGKSEVWSPQFIAPNRDGSLISVLCAGSTVSGNRHMKFAFWHPASNTTAFFRSDEGAFAGLWTEGSGSPNQHLPDAIVMDANDHLWVVTSALLDNATQLHLDEFSLTVGFGTITPTHLNRYSMLNQDGGVNSWSYFVSGMTYNEATDTIVFHWFCSFPAFTHFGHDPAPDFTPYSALESNNTPTQFRITKFDLASRSKKFSEADSVRLNDGSGGSFLDNFGSGGIGRGSQLNERASGISDLVGTVMNFDGDRTPGLWTSQSWTVYVWDPKTAVESFSGHVGFVLVDINTGIGVLHQPRVWDDFVDPSDGSSRGVQFHGGSVYEPSTLCFWAARYGWTQEATDASNSVFLNVDQGFGRYFLNPGSAPQPWNLQQINEDIANRTYALNIDTDTEFSALSEIFPQGFDIDQRRSARENIDQLRAAYLYDIVDVDHLLVAKLREGQTSLVTIDEDKVAAVDGRRHISFTDANEQELPRWLDLLYYDIDRDHQISGEPAWISGGTQNDRNAAKLQVAVVMDSDEAATTANRVLRALHEEKETTRFALSQKYLKYTSADVITLTRGGRSFEVKIFNNLLSTNWALGFEAAKHDSGIYSITARGRVIDPVSLPTSFAGGLVAGSGSGGQGPAITLVPEPRLVVLDTGMTEEQYNTIGYFITAFPLLSEANGGRWAGCDIEISSASAGPYTFKGRIEEPPIAGEVLEPLATVEEWGGFDRDTVLKVNITSGRPISVSETRLWQEPDLNLAFVGNELIQFADAFEKADGEFWISTLLRGRRGTEWAISEHEADEAFVVWDTSRFINITYDSFLIDKTRYWRAKNDWQGQYSSVATADQATRRLWPLAPVNIEIHRDSNDAIRATFSRRSRTRGEPLEDPPLFEASEDYEADIISPLGAVIRTITTTASVGGSVISVGTGRNVYYSSTDQLTDLGGPVPESVGYLIRIYQLSAVVDRGYPGEAEL